MASNWVKLNVGGQLFHTTSTTLLSWPDSILAKMFDPESGFAPPYSENGVYFLDADPKYFSVILNWLRYGEIMLDADINPRNMAKVADYFGLEKLVKEIRETGAVVISCDESECSKYCGDCLGLYLKLTDKSYSQAGGKMFLYQTSDGVWYINDTPTEKKGLLSNDSAVGEENNILLRTGWKFFDRYDEWKDVNLKMIEPKDFTFCNVLTVSSTTYSKQEFLGEFRIRSQVWLNGWQAYKNKNGKYLFVSQDAVWYISNTMDGESADNIDYSEYALSSKKVTTCPANSQAGTWEYQDGQGLWREDETFMIKCDVHK